ncbi:MULTISPECIES: FecR family protein [unclassified Caulobacter]|uniref:FecR family protein n=1 Tax=unclassified Caulobacter TaxID=2648921 RepID=UPI0006FE1EC7|nr:MULTISPECIES: FecR family protein [unclassified Caulobacter]KQV58745.1 iron dicitrate transport regulator FecR [Caulobacter sp. Root342]KQV68746.1 iron dicitrate transport regulator FecR [Caulobacter sp. Root343]
MERETGSRRETVRQAAALWVVRLDDPSCSDADRAAFQAWRDESHEHEAAFEREAVAWARLDRLRVLRPPGERPDRDLLEPARRSSLPGLSRSPWARGMAAAAVAALVVTGVMSFGTSTAYATAIGERRVVVLSDNSRIELNTDSKVVVRYRNGVREVRLVRGEAVFEAAKDARPFVIKAADAVMQADGSAELAVRLRSDGAVVTVRKGAVDLDPEPTERKDELRLNAGVAAIYGSAGSRSRSVSESEIDRALAWRQGAIALNGQSLEQAVAEFNRYNRQQVSIADPSISGLRLAGYFQTTEPKGFVAAVTSAFPVRATEGADGTIRLSRRG